MRGMSYILGKIPYQVQGSNLIGVSAELSDEVVDLFSRNR